MAKNTKYYCDKCGEEMSDCWYNHINCRIAVDGYVTHADLCKKCGDKLQKIVEEYLNNKENKPC